MPGRRVTNTPTVYDWEREAHLYAAVSDDRGVRRAWGVRPVADGELKIFMTRRMADEYAELYNLGEVVAVDVLTHG